MSPVSALSRGVIEGFFGRPWSWKQRWLHYADFLRDLDYDFYIYAPKADRRLRRDWRDAWPAETAAAAARAAEDFREAGLSFGIGLTPFEAYRDFDGAARRSLLAKVSDLDATGADLLCLLFDDMRGDLPDLAERQVEIVEAAAAASKAAQVIVCPTYYSTDPRLERVFGAMPADYLATLGRLLDPRIAIFWTGPQVCSPRLPRDHLLATADLLRRKPFLWDNSLANDGATSANYLPLKPAVAACAPPEDLLAGRAVNPMNQHWLSHLPLAMLSAAARQGDETERDLVFAGICRRLCGEDMALVILRDQPLFQEQGLGALSPQRRQALIADYEGFTHNDYADEVVDWLNGRYAFDPACLTD